MSEDDVRIVGLSEVNEETLNAFMKTAYTSTKVEFLRHYGGWRHRGNENRFLLLKGDRIAGYSAVIAEPLFLGDRTIQASWLVDVYVHEDFRGQKLQRYLDAKAKSSSDVLLGFPNHLAAKVHRKHGWGVRDDYRVMMLPLRPPMISAISQLRGAKGTALRIAAHLAAPVALMYRWWITNQKINLAWVIEEPDATTLASVFEKYREGWITTDRDIEFFRWRYLDAPYRSQLTFFGAGKSSLEPSVISVVRYVPRERSVTARVLDIFGDLRDKTSLSEIVRLVRKHAAIEGASHVTALATNPEIRTALRSNHFVVEVPLRFCWVANDKEIMQIINEGKCHWCYADSDADSID